ncbi:hypothetical protein DFH29DRAFT_874450 [Suillus ampliporus]|nr:hypothetical protein DFH29DRAFT_874450 [Suillus ampliporus]
MTPYTTLKHSQQDKSRQFKDALDDAWNQLKQATKTIAMSHHKSVCHVQNDLYIGHGLLHLRHSKLNAWNAFCWKKNQETNNCNQGQGALKLLIHENRDEYLQLSKDEKDNILAEYANWKKTKVTGLYISMKSKINDITQTLKAVENEISLCVQHFMGSVMGINNQDLVSKMEGFAVQGMKGATTNHKQQVSEIRLKICNIINTKLCNIFDSCALIELITGDPNARMQWTHYY